MELTNLGRDVFTAYLEFDNIGIKTFTIFAFIDEYKTWAKRSKIKMNAGQDELLVNQEGYILLQRIKNEAKDRDSLAKIDAAIEKVYAGKTSVYEVLITDEFAEIFRIYPLFTLSTESQSNCFEVKRQLAGFSAWYQFFPRSIGAIKHLDGRITQGTLKTAAEHLDYAKDLGFDIVYLGPVNPIGTAFRKGKNNAIQAEADDVGSPWAIGSNAGGHDALNPDLGTAKDFKNFIKKAHELGLEVSIDLALQASPDHPWVKTHPEWFTLRADGTIAYAENPPKKYQDIYPINFDNDPEGIRDEIIRIIEHWAELGVSVIRVDNPHTKPLWMWEYVIKKVHETYPEVIFLAEAFTRPPMMEALGKIGYEQLHSYFPWRNTKQEVEEYLRTVNSSASFFGYSTFWTSTPDILTEFLVKGDVNAHKIRAILAAMGSVTWGMYSGYEFVENVQREGFEEHIDSEKYEIKFRDYDKADEHGIASLVRLLNEIRKNNPALWSQHNLAVHKTDNASVVCFSKSVPLKNDMRNTIITVANLNFAKEKHAKIKFDLKKIGIDATRRKQKTLLVKDLFTNETFDWDFSISLDPKKDVARIFEVISYAN